MRAAVRTGKVVKVTVKAGRAVGFSAPPSTAFDTFKARFAAAVGAKDAQSIVDFGLNPDVKAPKGKVLYSFTPEGAVTLVVGNDVWAGGNNTTPFEQAFFLPDATVTVDGKAVVENGVLKP